MCGEMVGLVDEDVRVRWSFVHKGGYQCIAIAFILCSAAIFSVQMMEPRPTSPRFLILPCISRDMRILPLLPADCEELGPESEVGSFFRKSTTKRDSRFNFEGLADPEERHLSH